PSPHSAIFARGFGETNPSRDAPREPQSSPTKGDGFARPKLAAGERRMAGRQGIFEGAFPVFSDFHQTSLSSSNSTIWPALAFSAALRPFLPFSDFRGTMTLDMTLIGPAFPTIF